MVPDIRVKFGLATAIGFDHREVTAGATVELRSLGNMLPFGIPTGCPAFDRLVGSRLFVANAELRFPLVGIFKGEFDYGPLPVEGFLFADTGVAWTSDNEPDFLSAADRGLVSSAGFGLRVNPFGYVILEFAGVKPFDRPDNGWRFVFNIVPGF